MKGTRYKINGNLRGTVSKYLVWAIEDCSNNTIVAKLYGPTAYAVAVAACEHLNSVDCVVFKDGWLQVAYEKQSTNENPSDFENRV